MLTKLLSKKPNRAFTKNAINSEQLNVSFTSYKVAPPQFTVINVNEECFFKCQMCFKWKPDIHNPTDAKRTTTGEIKQFISGLRKLVNKGYVLTFAGGEPFLRKDLLDIIKFSSELGFFTQVVTNGWLINSEKKAKEIVKSGLGGIIFSIDGATADTHDKMRRHPGSFKRAVQAIKFLGKYRDLLQSNRSFNDRLCISIQTVLCELNYHEAIDMINWVDSSDIRAINFHALSEPNNTRHDPYWYKNEFSHLWPKDIDKFTKILDIVSEMKKSGSKIVQSTFELKSYINYFKYPEKFVKNGPCNFDKTLSLSSIGDMFLCFNYKRIGNIRNISLTDAWKSYSTESIRKDIRKCERNCHFLLNSSN